MGAGLSPGEQIDGRYVVEGLLGQGGMATVYRARELATGRGVAIKVMGLSGGGEAILDLERFRREARLAAAAQATGGVVRVHRLGAHRGQPYCVLDLVEGPDLERALAAELPRDRLLEVVEQVARTVAAVHRGGAVHRDLKPANVLLDELGRPWVADFGLARSLAKGSLASLTRTGEILGTPAYMAPEQIRDSGSVDERADVYALGAILYRGLAGRPPYQGSALAVMERALKGSPPPPSSLAPDVALDLDAVCACAMARDPADRYRSALALAEDVARARRGEPVAARPLGQQRRWAVAAAAAAAVGLVLALGLSARPPSGSTDEAAPGEAGQPSPPRAAEDWLEAWRRGDLEPGAFLDSALRTSRRAPGGLRADLEGDIERALAAVWEQRLVAAAEGEDRAKALGVAFDRWARRLPGEWVAGARAAGAAAADPPLERWATDAADDDLRRGMVRLALVVAGRLPVCLELDLLNQALGRRAQAWIDGAAEAGASEADARRAVVREALAHRLFGAVWRAPAGLSEALRRVEGSGFVERSPELLLGFYRCPEPLPVVLGLDEVRAAALAEYADAAAWARLAADVPHSPALRYARWVRPVHALLTMSPDGMREALDEEQARWLEGAVLEGAEVVAATPTDLGRIHRASFALEVAKLSLVVPDSGSRRFLELRRDVARLARANLDFDRSNPKDLISALLREVEAVGGLDGSAAALATAREGAALLERWVAGESDPDKRPRVRAAQIAFLAQAIPSFLAAEEAAEGDRRLAAAMAGGLPDSRKRDHDIYMSGIRGRVVLLEACGRPDEAAQVLAEGARLVARNAFQEDPDRGYRDAAECLAIGRALEGLSPEGVSALDDLDGFLKETFGGRAPRPDPSNGGG